MFGNNGVTRSDELIEVDNDPTDEIEEVDSEDDEFEREREENYEIETAGPPDYGNEDPEDDSEQAWDDVLKAIENPDRFS